MVDHDGHYTSSVGFPSLHYLHTHHAHTLYTHTHTHHTFTHMVGWFVPVGWFRIGWFPPPPHHFPSPTTHTHTHTPTTTTTTTPRPSHTFSSQDSLLIPIPLPPHPLTFNSPRRKRKALPHLALWCSQWWSVVGDGGSGGTVVGTFFFLLGLSPTSLPHLSLSDLVSEWKNVVSGRKEEVEMV